MTIHHIINNYNLEEGGAQRLVIDLHYGALNSGFSSKILGLSNEPKNNIREAKTLKYRTPYNPLILYYLWRYLSQEVKSGDVLHVHLFPAIFFMSLLKIFRLLKRCKLILTEHNTTNRRRKHILGWIVDYWIYKSYDYIIAISSGTKNALLNYKPKLANKLKVINNGAHLRFKEFIIRNTKSKLIIISVGRLHEQKNYEITLKALAKIKNLNFEYWITGIGPLENDLKTLTCTLGLETKVKFLGYVSDIGVILKRADIFIMISKWEGFGIAAVEAMNAGLPAVISNVPGLRDLFQENGKDCFLVCPNNEEEISENISKLIHNKTLRIDMGRKAFHQSKNFGISRMVDKHLSFYKNSINA